MALFSKKQSQDSPRRRQSIPEQRATNEELDQKYAFRRNRTLTGSSSSGVSSANEQSAQMKSSRVHVHDLAQKRRKLGSILIGVVGGIVALYILLSQFTASVLLRTNDITTALDPSYNQTISDYFGTQPVERLRFLLNANRLTSYLQNNHPEIKTIEITGSNGVGQTNITLSMREPVVSWNIGGVQQYVDKDGVAFKKNYYSIPAVQIIDNSGITVSSGQTIASNRFLGFVGRLVGLVKTHGFSAQQITIPLATTRQVELTVAEVPYPMKFSIDRSVGEQAEDMARAVQYFITRGVNPQYLDLRVSNKAFYR